MEKNAQGQLSRWDPRRLLRAIGPAVIIAASIVGPGTVTTASRTGADWQYAFLWAMAFTPVLAYWFEEPGIPPAQLSLCVLLHKTLSFLCLCRQTAM